MSNTTSNDLFDTPCDNDYSLEMTRFIVQKILVPFITSIGFVGNLLCIIVLTHKSMVSSTNCYLTALAIFDISYLILSFTLSLKHYAVVKSLEAYIYWYPYARTFTDICSNVSVCLTVTFSLERLIAVCYPMKGRVICTPQRARFITLLVVTFAVISTFPEFFEMKTVRIKNNITVVLKNTETDFAKTDAYKIFYYHYLVLTFTFLPFILLSTFNGILVRTVYSAMRIRKRMTNSYSSNKQNARRQAEQNRITIMLIGVVIVFLLCQSPNAALILYLTYLDSNDMLLTACEANNVKIAGNVVNMMVLINASINFILYSAMSTKFRRVFVRLLCFCERYGLDFFTRTETSSYNGHSMKGPELPLRFRSGRRQNYVYSPHKHVPIQNKNNCRTRGFYHNGHNDQKQPLTFFKTTRSSSSSHNASCSSNDDDAFTPIVMRKTNKHRVNGSTMCQRFRRNNNSKIMSQIALSDEKRKVSDDVYLIKLSLKATISKRQHRNQDTKI
ncbi:FMRFamide receptor-like [Mya arenaria]|uniref:FMRFamide receptor-like n=1 Tax=Mya arenaria TaxID=6604 RepID=UPI0022E54A1F|nr:FMRFamide receptor-like [Mya arenaria]